MSLNSPPQLTQYIKNTLGHGTLCALQGQAASLGLDGSGSVVNTAIQRVIKDNKPEHIMTLPPQELQSLIEAAVHDQARQVNTPPGTGNYPTFR